jgi:hypothetical protein
MPGKKSALECRLQHKTFIKALSLCSFSIGSPPSAVDVKDGKIVRISPFHYDWK